MTTKPRSICLTLSITVFPWFRFLKYVPATLQIVPSFITFHVAFTSAGKMFKKPTFTLLFIAARAGLSLACTAVSQVHFSNYGFPDASGLTQFSCAGSQAVTANVPTPLGTGSFSSPYSFATSTTSQTFQKCETIYIPYFRKYFKWTDICAQCRKS